MINKILIIIFICILWYFNNKKVENFEQDKLLNKIYRDLTLEEFKKDLKHNEINIPEKLIKVIFFKFKKMAENDNINIDFVINKLRVFDKTEKHNNNDFINKYIKKIIQQ